MNVPAPIQLQCSTKLNNVSNLLSKLAVTAMLFSASICNAQFRGGSGQGFATGNAAAAPLGISIYKGGSDDGISLFSLASASLGTNIYKGGADDGFTVFNGAAASLGVNTYKGGGNDGWAVSLAGLLIPLPVTLTKFNGAWLLDDAVLNWETATELNSDHFEVERSFDGRDFTAIGNVGAAGESNDIRKYQYTDPRIRLSLPAGMVYYRLKTVDRDGSFTYSAIVILKSTSTQIAYSLYPNPAKDKITMQVVGNGATGMAMLYLYDVNGRLVKRTSMLGNRQELDIRDLSAGTYVVVLMVEGNAVYNQKIIVQK